MKRLLILLAMSLAAICTGCKEAPVVSAVELETLKAKAWGLTNVLNIVRYEAQKETIP
jgi:C4-dicarboxylate transporter